MTEKIPKSMVEFSNKTLLARIIDTFKECKIIDISVVVGHNSDVINFPNIKYFVNEKFAQTNMLESLFCAEENIEGSVIISYADILFEKKILAKLIESNADITLVVDKNWIEYWKLRVENPIDDAHETVILDSEDNIIGIGQEVKNIDEVDGHFIGLMKVQNDGIKLLKDFYHKSKRNATSEYNPLNPHLTFENSRLVDLIQGLVCSGIQVKSIPIKNGWLEFDTIKDYELYNNMKKNNTLSNIIKLEEVG